MLCLSPGPSSPLSGAPGGAASPAVPGCPFPGQVQGQLWADALASLPQRQPGRGCGGAGHPLPASLPAPPALTGHGCRCSCGPGPSARRRPGARAPQPLPGPPPVRTRHSLGAGAQREASLAKKSNGTRSGKIPRPPRLPENRDC